MAIEERPVPGPWYPPFMRWFLADLVVEYAFEGIEQRTAQFNLVLVEAPGPIEAFERALELGHAYTDTFVNTDGQTVTAEFKGLRDLFVIYEELEHGTEVLFEEIEGVSPRQIESFVKPRNSLAAFAPGEREAGAGRERPSSRK